VTHLAGEARGHERCNAPPMLQNKVVVVTGASSGLGRAAALELARRGARVVLAARREPPLQNLADACREHGTEALVVPTDVTDEAAVARLARAALEFGGAVHAWVNNAGVTSFGLLESTPVDVLRRVLETNLWGSIYGARAVLPIFRAQGEGVLINIGSILSKVGQPFVPSYVISKFALHGLTEALRAELADEPHIHVCTLLPYAIDTPHFQEGANFTGRTPFAMPPVQAPEVVAKALVDLLERPRRQRHVPRVAALGLALHALLPGPVEHVIRHSLSRWHLVGEQAPEPRGNLWEPGSSLATVHGSRPPRVGLSQLLGWILGHYAMLGVRRLARS